MMIGRKTSSRPSSLLKVPIIKPKQGTVLVILMPKQILQRLPTGLA